MEQNLEKLNQKFDYLLFQIEKGNSFEWLDKGIIYEIFQQVKEWKLMFGYKFNVYPNDHLINNKKHFHLDNNEKNIHVKIDFNGVILSSNGNELPKKIQECINYFLSKEKNLNIINEIWDKNY